jgi:hypothetical protein
MAFLYPAFLIGAVAIALPIVLHLLRRDIAPEVPFTAVRLLRRSPVERVHKRRLKDLLLLAARVIALLLLAAAFARPYVRGAAPAPVRVVALDRSYSMGGPQRFDRARALARAAIEDASSSERVAFVAFDDRADVLAMPGGKGEARAALDGTTLGFGATRYSAVFDKVLEMANGATGRLILVTDLQPSGWNKEGAPVLPLGWEMEVRDAGSVGENLTIEAVTVDAAAVAATIRNSGRTPRSGRIQVTLDERGPEAAGADFTVAPGQASVARINWRAPSTGALTVSVDDPVGLAADNSRYVVLGARQTPKALVVGAGEQSGLYLSRALETSRTEDVDVVTSARLASMTPEEVSNYSTIALLTTRALERKSRETIAAQVRAGSGLFIAAGSDLDISVVASMADWQPALSAVEHGQGPPLTLAATDVRHPIFRPFNALAVNLGQVRFERSWRVAPEGWSVIARFSNGSPALLERTLGRGRVVLFASDVDRQWNDFPLHPGFVPFAIETARYLSASGDRRQVRDYTVAQAPPGIGPAPGVFRTADNRTVAVNVDPAEGALDRMSAEAFAGKIQRNDAAGSVQQAQARDTESRQSYWQYGLALMLLALVAESFVGRA